LLLTLIYYVNADTYLVDPAKADLTAGQAVAIGCRATLAGGWAFYEVFVALAARQARLDPARP